MKIALIQGSSQKDKNPLLDLKKICNIRNFFFSCNGRGKVILGL
ncbi:hypothetical protein [Treponema succinifaciens]